VTENKRLSNPAGADRTWEPPAITKLPVNRQTKSSAHVDDGIPEEPDSPSQPATKLGFSFEMALPLSSRTQR